MIKMNQERKPVILFYPTGIVHFRNLEILKKSLPGSRFRVILESWVKEKAAEVLENMEPGNLAVVENEQLSRDAWEHVGALFLSMAYPNRFRLELVYEAAKRDIPVMAIEEVNQLALNDGVINHYFLPLDYIGVPSNQEREKFLQLGVPEEAVMVTGWPFFDYETALQNHGNFDMRTKYNLPAEVKCCLLVLGSLKELDMVSLETRKVRQEILRIVSGGLLDTYRLLIKPHPIETETGLAEIQKQVPDAIVLDPKIPIEILLSQSDLVVNRGNSQVTLLAMILEKPIIVVPVGLKTIFHGTADLLISNSPAEFRRILEDYARGEKKDYSKILSIHFPFTQEQALEKVNHLFAAALEKERTGSMDKKNCISVLFAFLGDMERAKEIVVEFPQHEQALLLKKLYHHDIAPGEFKILLDYFPGKIMRWHLQALFIRAFTKGKSRKEGAEYRLSLLEGFDGEVNPHYFMEDIVKRVELEYRAGNETKAEELIEKFYEDYAVFDYYKQAFDMPRFVYHNRRKYWSFRKALWLLRNLNKAYTRKYVKENLGSLRSQRE